MQCHTVSKELEPVLETRIIPSPDKKKKNVKRISLSVEAATFRLKLGPLASSSRL